MAAGCGQFLAPRLVSLASGQWRPFFSSGMFVETNRWVLQLGYRTQMSRKPALIPVFAAWLVGDSREDDNPDNILGGTSHHDHQQTGIWQRACDPVSEGFGEMPLWALQFCFSRFFHGFWGNLCPMGFWSFVFFLGLFHGFYVTCYDLIFSKCHRFTFFPHAGARSVRGNSRDTRQVHHK